MAESEAEDVVVIDNGSGVLKAGLSGFGEPEIVVQNVVCKTPESGILPTPRLGEVTLKSTKAKGVSYGVADGYMDVNWPIKRGVIEDWETMQSMWEHTLYELGTVPNEFSTLVTAQPVTRRTQLEKQAEIWIEALQTNSLMIEFGSKLGLYGSGRSTGLAVDVGFGVTSVMPIYEGTVTRAEANNLDVGILQAGFGGSDVSFALSSYLATEGETPSTQYLDTFQQLELVKQQHCFVANGADFDETRDARTFELPDGRTINMASSRYRAAERMFSGDFSLPEMIHSSWKALDVDLRRPMTDSIVLLGGATRMTGFSQRLTDSVQALISGRAQVHVVAPENQHACWTGGSIMGSLGQFRELWVTREQYEECGSSRIAGERFLKEVTEARYLGGLALQLPQRSARLEGSVHSGAVPSLEEAFGAVMEIPAIPRYPTAGEKSAVLTRVRMELPAATTPLAKTYDMAALAEDERNSQWLQLKQLHAKEARMLDLVFAAACHQEQSGAGVFVAAETTTGSQAQMKAMLDGPSLFAPQKKPGSAVSSPNLRRQSWGKGKGKGKGLGKRASTTIGSRLSLSLPAAVPDFEELNTLRHKRDKILIKALQTAVREKQLKLAFLELAPNHKAEVELMEIHRVAIERLEANPKDNCALGSVVALLLGDSAPLVEALPRSQSEEEARVLSKLQSTASNDARLAMLRRLIEDALVQRCEACGQGVLEQPTCLALQCSNCSRVWCCFCGNVYTRKVAVHNHMARCEENHEHSACAREDTAQVLEMREGLRKARDIERILDTIVPEDLEVEIMEQCMDLFEAAGID